MTKGEDCGFIDAASWEEVKNKGDATVKKFYGSKHQVRLEPANANYKPIVVRPPQRVQIQGVVVGVIRKYV